jgi:hypothetical protein
LTSKGAVALLKVNVIEVFGVSSASNMSFTFEVLPSETLYSDGDVVKLEKVGVVITDSRAAYKLC